MQFAVCLYVCLSVCLSVCLPVCLSVCFSTLSHISQWGSSSVRSRNLKVIMMYICAEPQLGKEGGGGETALNQITGKVLDGVWMVGREGTEG